MAFLISRPSESVIVISVGAAGDVVVGQDEARCRPATSMMTPLAGADLLEHAVVRLAAVAETLREVGLAVAVAVGEELAEHVVVERQRRDAGLDASCAPGC